MKTANLADFAPEPPERPKTIPVAVRLRVDVADKLDAVAEALNMRKSAVIHAMILREYDNLYE